MTDKKTAWGFSLFFLFLAFSFFVSSGIFSEFDLKLLTLSQKEIPQIFDLPFSVFSVLGTFEVVSVILLACLVIVYKTNKFSVLFGFGLIAVVELFGKIMIHQKGPPLELLRTIHLLP